MRIALALLLFAFHLSPLNAAEPLSVQFAGLAFIGEHQHLQTSFPLSKSIIDQARSAGAPLERNLWSELGALQNPSFRVIVDQLVDMDKSASAIVLALALDRETLSVEKIGDDYKLLVDLSAQLLFFDFKQSVIVASYPIANRHTATFKSPPTAPQIQDAVHATLAGGSESLLERATRQLAGIELKQKAGARIGIRNVNVESGTDAFLPADLRERPDLVKIMLAQQFSAFLSHNQNVAVLPYTKGDAIGNRMALRIANGDVFDLRMPEPDFVFDLTLQGFKKKLFGQVPAGSSWIYGAFVRIALSEPLSGQEYMRGDFKNGETKTVPASQSNVDHWASYQEALLGLFQHLTLAFSQPADDWLKSASADKSISRQLLAANKVLEKCK